MVWLLPKEHGAYGQMSVPLVVALATAGLNPAAWLLSLAVVATFLAHESLVVLLGRRGTRASRDLGAAAARWLVTLGAFALVTGVVALIWMPWPARWSLALPLVPATVVAFAIFAGREKQWPAEVSVATAFSLAAVPVCLAGQVPPQTAAVIAGVCALHFVVATLAVRVVIFEARGSREPRALRLTRRAVLLLALSGLAAAGSAGATGTLSWIPLLALLPGLGSAMWLAWRPPSPTKLRQIGWSLVAASVMMASLLIAGLRD